jgi:hypothetical protein
MATIDIRYTHKTDLADARARTRKLLALFAEEKKELVKSIEWLDDSRAVAHGRGFEGRFQVTDRDIVIAIDLNLLTRPFKSKVEDRLLQRIEAEFGAGRA